MVGICKKHHRWKEAYFCCYRLQASLLSSLHHPNIVSYRESFQDSHGVLHIVMGYCEGGDLCTRLKGCGGQLLPETQVVEWFVQIALALQYLHDRKILHRDLKVSNRWCVYTLAGRPLSSAHIFKWTLLALRY